MRVRLAFEASSGLGQCTTTGGCVEFTLGTLAWLLVTVGGFAVFLFAPQNVRVAREVVRVEIERVRDERAALAAFARRVGELTPDAVQQGGSGAIGLLGPRGGDGIDKVRTAYRETVMAVDHYEEDYGEPLERNLAIEFGEDVAAAVTQNDSLPPGLTDAVVAGASEGRAVRSTYLETLETEDDRLADAADRLTSIDAERDRLTDRNLRLRGFEELRDRWESVAALRCDLEEFLRAQQRRRRNRRAAARRVPTDAAFYDYLYRDLEVRHPVLADGVELYGRLADLDHRLTRAIAGRP